MTNSHYKRERDFTKRPSSKKIIRQMINAVNNTLIIYIGLTTLNNILPNPNVEQYVRKNQDAVERRVAETTCIDMQFSEKVQYGLPDSGIINILSSAVVSTYGQYDPNDDTIYMNDNILTTDEFTARNIFSWLVLGAEKTNTLSTLVHEQTHSYLERIASEEGVDMGWVIRNPDTTFADRLSARFVGEGLAEYFRSRYKGEMPEQISGWSEQAKRMYEGGNFNIFNISKAYTLGLSLVAPIVDQYGEAGVRHLVRNRPKDEELANLAVYQAKALKELSQHYPKTVCPMQEK